MTTLRRLDLTDEIQQRIAAVERALKTYRPGGQSAAVVELPKLALANAVLAAVAAQTAAVDALLAALPKPRPAGVRPRARRRRA